MAPELLKLSQTFQMSLLHILTHRTLIFAMFCSKIAWFCLETHFNFMGGKKIQKYSPMF